MPTWTILSSSFSLLPVSLPFFLPFSLTFSPRFLVPPTPALKPFHRNQCKEWAVGRWMQSSGMVFHGCRKISAIFPLVFYSCPFSPLFPTRGMKGGGGEFLPRFAISLRVIQTLAHSPKRLEWHCWLCPHLSQCVLLSPTLFLLFPSFPTWLLGSRRRRTSFSTPRSCCLIWFSQVVVAFPAAWFTYI